MTGRVDEAPPEPDKSAGVQEIERDLEYTREQLGETVDELTDRLSESVRPVSYVAGAVAVVAVAVIVVVVWRRRK